MPNTTAPAGRADELDTFLDLVFEDPELVRAEFDDLIAACWDDSPPSPPSRRRRPAPQPRSAPRPASQAGPGATTTALRNAEARQRGPPGRSGCFLAFGFDDGHAVGQ